MGTFLMWSQGDIFIVVQQTIFRSSNFANSAYSQSHGVELRRNHVVSSLPEMLAPHEQT